MAIPLKPRSAQLTSLIAEAQRTGKSIGQLLQERFGVRPLSANPADVVTRERTDAGRWEDKLPTDDSATWTSADWQREKAASSGDHQYLTIPQANDGFELRLQDILNEVLPGYREALTRSIRPWEPRTRNMTITEPIGIPHLALDPAVKMGMGGWEGVPEGGIPTKEGAYIPARRQGSLYPSSPSGRAPIVNRLLAISSGRDLTADPAGRARLALMPPEVQALYRRLDEQAQPPIPSIQQTMDRFAQMSPEERAQAGVLTPPPGLPNDTIDLMKEIRNAGMERRRPTVAQRSVAPPAPPSTAPPGALYASDLPSTPLLPPAAPAPPGDLYASKLLDDIERLRSHDDRVRMKAQDTGRRIEAFNEGFGPRIDPTGQKMFAPRAWSAPPNQAFPKDNPLHHQLARAIRPQMEAARFIQAASEALDAMRVRYGLEPVVVKQYHEFFDRFSDVLTPEEWLAIRDHVEADLNSLLSTPKSASIFEKVAASVKGARTVDPGALHKAAPGMEDGQVISGEVGGVEDLAPGPSRSSFTDTGDLASEDGVPRVVDPDIEVHTTHDRTGLHGDIIEGSWLGGKSPVTDAEWEAYRKTARTPSMADSAGAEGERNAYAGFQTFPDEIKDAPLRSVPEDDAPPSPFNATPGELVDTPYGRGTLLTITAPKIEHRTLVGGGRTADGDTWFNQGYYLDRRGQRPVAVDYEGNVRTDKQGNPYYQSVPGPVARVELADGRVVEVPASRVQSLASEGAGSRYINWNPQLRDAFLELRRQFNDAVTKNDMATAEALHARMMDMEVGEGVVPGVPKAVAGAGEAPPAKAASATSAPSPDLPPQIASLLGWRPTAQTPDLPRGLRPLGERITVEGMATPASRVQPRNLPENILAKIGGWKERSAVGSGKTVAPEPPTPRPAASIPSAPLDERLGPTVSHLVDALPTEPAPRQRGTLTPEQLLARIKEETGATAAATPAPAPTTGARLRKLAPALAVGATAAAGVLGSSEEAEALPPLRAAKATTMRGAGGVVPLQQTRTTRAVHTQPASVRFQQKYVNDLHLLERVMLATEDGTLNRAEFGARANSGAGIADTFVEELQNTHEEVAKAGLMEPVIEALNYGAYAREISTVERKIEEAQARGRALLDMGDEAGAHQAFASVATMVRKRDTKTLTPLKMDRKELLAAREAALQQLSPDQRAIAEKAISTIHAQTRSLLNLLGDKGILPPEAVAALQTRGNDYIPLPRLFALYDDVRKEWVKKRFMSGGVGETSADRVRFAMSEASGDYLEEMAGSDLVNVNPWVAVTRFANDVVNEVQRNEAAKIFLTKAGDPAEAARIRAVAVVRPLSSPLRGEALEKARRQGLEQTAYMEKGKPRHYLVDRDIHNALNTVGPNAAKEMMHALGTVGRLFQTTAATANLAFIAKQVIAKDPLSWLVTADHSRHMKGGLAKDVTQVYLPAAARIIMDGVVYAGISKVIGTDFRGGQARYKATVKKLREAGAIGRPLGGYFDAERAILGWKPDEGLLRKPLSYINRALELPQEKLLEPLEVAWKGGAFETLRKRGFSESEAAFEAKRYAGSPDFNISGSVVRGWPKQMFVFLNPTIQGIARLAEKVKQNPKRLMKTAAALSGGLYALTQWNNQFRDEEGRPELSHVPRDVQKTNIILFHGNREQQADGQFRYNYWKIPIPHEAAALLAPALGAMMVMQGDPEYGTADAVIDAAEHWVPGGASIKANDPFYSGLRRVVGQMNPAIRAPVELLTKTRMQTGAPIEGSRIAGRLPEHRYTAHTDPFVKAVAQKISSVAPGAPEVMRSPDALEHIVKSFLPGVGEQALGLGQLAVPRPIKSFDLESSTEKLTNMPVLGSLFRGFMGAGGVDQRRLDAMNELYDVMNRAQQSKVTPGSVAKYNTAAFRDLDIPKLAAEGSPYLPLAKYAKALTDIAATREQLQTNPELKLSVEERRQKLAGLSALQNKLLDNSRTIIASLRQKGVIQ